MTIRMRFVQGNEVSSDLIEWHESVAMPISPSHVETVTPAGKYLGQHASGGMQAREPGYDAGTFAKEFFLDIPTSSQFQADTFYSYMEGSIGEPYDWKAMLGFVLPGHFHTKFQALCSAKVAIGLRKCLIFRWPLAVPDHLIDPRDLLLVLSAILEIPHY